ncbi:MAG TPA: OB-fold nucleic acid binding domain-containing protein, partial [Thermoanaerobaculia bacterium]|nr:OB-fold nucleic acid binding domain-containing protein [Thermoanaerobaculia bacterium]
MSETASEATTTSEGAATAKDVAVRHLREHDGELVSVRGWVASARSSGKIAFLQVRDGSGIVQCVVSRRDVSE